MEFSVMVHTKGTEFTPKVFTVTETKIISFVAAKKQLMHHFVMVLTLNK